MNKSTKLAFIGSLVLNLLLLGFVIGQSPRRFDRGAMREQLMEQKIKDLPEDSQARLRQRFKLLRTTAEPLFNQLRQAQDEMVGLIGAEPFDPAAFERQEAKIIQFRAETTKQLSQTVKDAVKELTPEERRRFAEILRRPSPSSRS
jgi:Predicted integral membrane protein